MAGHQSGRIETGGADMAPNARDTGGGWSAGEWAPPRWSSATRRPTAPRFRPDADGRAIKPLRPLKSVMTMVVARAEVSHFRHFDDEKVVH